MSEFEVISPIDGSVYVRRQYADARAIDRALSSAKAALVSWRKVTLAERSAVVIAFVERMRERADELAQTLTWQMGRPLGQADETPRLVGATREAAELAATALAAEPFPGDVLAERRVTRLARPWPTGLHLSICAWNYPTAMLSSLVSTPLIAGNVVILKHSPQTPVIAEIAAEAFVEAGGPTGVFQSLHLSHESAEQLMQAGSFDTVNFIGSVAGGRRVNIAAAAGFTDVHLELGGKDATYIRHDADLDLLVPQIAEGCFSNSGQSCCSVERIYVHQGLHSEFVEALEAETRRWRLGHPIEDSPDIGPLCRSAAADYVRGQVADAEKAGARRVLGAGRHPLDHEGTAYIAPDILVDVTADMSIMRDELFGPVACVQSVRSDEEALALINDSDYGLTGSVWTEDSDTGLALLEDLEAGTVYLNRCDHADPYLPWGGVKNSGLGRNNGVAGLRSATAAKSFHLNEAISGYPP